MLVLEVGRAQLIGALFSLHASPHKTQMVCRCARNALLTTQRVPAHLCVPVGLPEMLEKFLQKPKKTGHNTKTGSYQRLNAFLIIFSTSFRFVKQV